MVLQPDFLSAGVDPAVGLGAVAVHVPPGPRDAAVAHQVGDLVRGLRGQGPEVPLHVVVAQPVVGAALLRADEVLELHRVLDEEHRGVVADQVVVALGGVELDREPARVPPGVGGSPLPRHGREPDDQPGRGAGLEHGRLGELADVVRHLEPAECAAALGVRLPLRDPLAVELGHLLDQVAVLEQDRATGADGQRVLVALDRDAGVRGGWLGLVGGHARTSLVDGTRARAGPRVQLPPHHHPSKPVPPRRPRFHTQRIDAYAKRSLTCAAVSERSSQSPRMSRSAHETIRSREASSTAIPRLPRICRMASARPAASPCAALFDALPTELRLVGDELLVHQFSPLLLAGRPTRPASVISTRVRAVSPSIALSAPASASSMALTSELRPWVRAEKTAKVRSPPASATSVTPARGRRWPADQRWRGAGGRVRRSNGPFDRTSLELLTCLVSPCRGLGPTAARSRRGRRRCR